MIHFHNAPNILKPNLDRQVDTFFGVVVFKGDTQSVTT